MTDQERGIILAALQDHAQCIKEELCTNNVKLEDIDSWLEYYAYLQKLIEKYKRRSL